MNKHPFVGVTLKKYLSGLDKAFDIDNITDKLIIAASDMKEIISAEMYSALMADNITDEKLTEALELLRYAMAPLAVYHNFIWLQIRVSSGGVTTLKNDNETTIFKSQSDEAKESLLVSHGIFTKELIDYLNANVPPADEPDNKFNPWKNSDQKKAFDSLLIKDYRDFDRYFNTEGNAAFFVRSRVLQQEAFDEINAHIKIKDVTTAETPDQVLIRRLKKALAYITVSKAMFDWDNYYLPAPVRRAIASETGSSKISPDDIKKKLSDKYRNVADDILRAIDTDNEVTRQAATTPTEPITINTIKVHRDDKHFLMM